MITSVVLTPVTVKCWWTETSMTTDPIAIANTVILTVDITHSRHSLRWVRKKVKMKK